MLPDQLDPPGKPEEEEKKIAFLPPFHFFGKGGNGRSS
jgi:hypothetical protein